MEDDNQRKPKSALSVLKEIKKSRRSPRIALIKSFSTYTNTLETPIDLTIESDVSTGKMMSKKDEQSGEHDVGVSNKEKANSKGDVTKHRLASSVQITKEVNISSKMTNIKKTPKKSVSPNLKRTSSALLRKLNKTPTPTKETVNFFKGVPKLINSDDDFVSPPTKKVKSTVDNAVSRQSYYPYDGKKIRPRIKTYKFCEYLKKLNTEQRSVVKEIGFQTILDLKIHQIPTSLGYWLVKNYNHETSVLDIGVARINITAEYVHELLGIPMGGINVAEMQRARGSDLVVNEWNSQFQQRSHIVSPSAFLEFIGGQQDCGRLFILNFLVAFTTMLGEVTSNNAVNRKFLTCINETDRVKDMNWCNYMITLMKRSKKKWNVDNEYNGSMVIHMLALAHFHCDKVKGADKLPPPVTRFTFGDLDNLELVESQRISFGAMQKLISNNNKNVVECEDKKRVNEVKKMLGKKDGIKKNEKEQTKIDKKVDCEVIPVTKEDVKQKGVVLETEFNSTPETEADVIPTGYCEEKKNEEIDLAHFGSQYQLTQVDAKVAAKLLYDLIQDFENNISDIKIHLEAAKEEFPNNSQIEEVEKFWKYVVGKYFNGESDKVVGGKRSDFSPEWLTPRTLEELDKTEREYTESKYKTPVQKTICFGLPTFDIGSPDGKDKTGSVSEIIVTDHIISDNNVKPTDENNNENNRPRRARTFGEAMCSPYVQRVVQLKKPFVKPESLVSDMIFAAIDGPWKVVFQSVNGLAVGSVVMETMRPGLYIHVSAVSSWAEVLNNEEKLRQKGTTHRLFCSAVMLFPDHYKEDKATQLEQFTSNMVSILKQQDLTSIKGVDLVLIPIMYSCRRHYYVMAFHLNTGKVELLDNIKCDASFSELYDDWPFIMQATFAEYLRLNKHGRASKIAKADLVIVDMPWRTVNNYVDCGVFAMRHMETYKGSTLKDWIGVCNLSKESDDNGRKQKAELDELRRKYVAKVLLSDVNEVKDEVLKSALLFDALPLEEKIKINSSAIDRIKQRLAGAID